MVARTALTVASLGACALLGVPAAGAAGGAPRLAGATVLDADRDGHVDRVLMTFSSAVRGGAQSNGRFAFKVKGYDVQSVAKASGRRVAVNVKERPECDLGLRPVVTFKPERGKGALTGVGGARPSGGKLDLAKRDHSAPRITCAATEDADNDGSIDGVLLTYSRAVKNRAQTNGDFPFNVDAYRIASVDKARGRFLHIALRERDSTDTDSKPAVTYRRPVKKSARKYAVTAGKTEAFTGTYRTTRDGATPLLLSARTDDGNADGSLDGLVARFSEPVEPSGAAAWSVSGATVSSVAQASGSELELRLSGAALDTGARPATSYTAGGSAVRDAAGNQAAAGSVTPADAAPPVLTSAVTADAGGAIGRLDRVSATFSEPVSHAADADGSYPLSVAGYQVAAAGASSGRQIDVSLAEGAGPDTGARPAVAYTRGPGGAVTDAAGNEARTQSFGGTGDGVAPQLLSATTLDQDGNGQLDGLSFTYSEPVSHPAEPGGSFAVSGLTVTSAGAASDSSVKLALLETGVPNTGLTPLTTYTPDGLADVTDAAGNLAPAVTVPAATDGARPAIVGARTLDTDANEKIDQIETTWSEPLSHADDSAAPFPLSASGGYSVTRVRAAVGSLLSVDVGEAASPDTGSAPTLTYAQGPSLAVTDAHGLEAAGRAYSALTRDDVAPGLVAATTDDANANGKLDRLNLQYSEPVTGAAAPNGFSVAGRTLQTVTYASAVVRLGIAEAGSPDTGSTPNLSYVPGDVRDLPQGPGDTAQNAAALASQASADRAPPILVSAVTGDNDANGAIDRVSATFSEPVSNPLDTSAPFSLDIDSRTVSQVQATSSSNTVTALVAEASSPDGGFKPALSVVSNPVAGDRVKDAAGNDAKPLTFSSTSDGVRPVLISAQMGENPGSGCAKTPPQDGRIDCIRTTWSEPVSHAADNDSVYPLSVGSPYGIAPAGIPQATDSTTLDVPLTEQPAPDRDQQTTVSYDGSIGAPQTPVRDAANLNALTTTPSVQAARACSDTASEPNDSQDPADPGTNPALTAGNQSPQRKCAFDDDWFRVTASAGGTLKAVVRPSAALATDVTLVDSGGTTVATAQETDASPSSNSPGQQDLLDPNGSSCCAAVSGLTPNATYWLHVSAPGIEEGTYCVSYTNDGQDPACGPNVGDLIFTEVGMGTDKFVEVKDLSDSPVDFATVQIHLFRAGSDCIVQPPLSGSPVLQPNQYAVITATPTSSTFGCSEVSSLSSSGDELQITSGTQIDTVNLAGILHDPLADNPSLQADKHSLEVKPAAENGTDNDDVQHNWCRTFAADNRGQLGDGCDHYRINEVLFNPPSVAPDGVQGRSFVELAGNLPAKAGSGLLGGWVMRGVNGENGNGNNSFVLPSSASPRSNGTFVVADGVDAIPSTTHVTNADVIWADFDPSEDAWPDPGFANPGPRGLQLLTPNPPSSPPCGSALADAFGWSITGEGFSQLNDSARSCSIVEPQQYVNPAQNRSAARDNLATPGSTDYNAANDTGHNSPDFCVQNPPNPGVLNSRPSCAG